MSNDSGDLSLLEYQYVIGFTKNQYYPSNHGSPTPGESRHSSVARGYAERCNKGAEKILSGASEMLERRRRKSVTKIHTDILDLMYELTERRKANSPTPKYRPDLHTIDSRLSMFSPPLSASSRSSSSNSLPIIEVQQLPPLSQATFTLPTINPEAHRTQYKSKLQRNKYAKLTFPKVEKEQSKVENKRVSAGVPARKIYRETKKIDYHNEVIGVNQTERQTVKEIKPKPILKRRNAGLKLFENMKAYVEKYSRKPPTKDKNKLSMSYCQCSYGERAEKGRISNVMKRYSSKTNAGPLDFTKLQRQIERSKTMVW